MRNEMSNSFQAGQFTRRRFLTAAGASALSLAVAAPATTRAGDADAKINIGLIGCGGRGTWIADLFLKNGNYNLAAVADYFPDRAEAAGNKFQVDQARRFSGLSAYERLLEQKLDAVAIESPPYFHPIHAAHPSYQEAVSLVHKGGIGRIISAEAGYQCGDTWSHHDAIIRKNDNAETRLRCWGADRTLSGDIITEQNIHALDVATWVLDAAPLRAYGTGGRARPALANGVWDNFSVIYEFPNDIRLTFNSKQDGKFWDDIICRAYGMEGTIDTHYFGVVKVMCDDAFNGGMMTDLYTDGVVNNIASFQKAIASADYSNSTVAPSARSTLTTILGRTAAYRRAEVTWEEMMSANEKWEANLSGLKT
jgi:predicted dehydrogenase